ncbi:MAG TPA: winged helix-turn-helix domain-containing protein [Pirellulales bacterium]|jgi:hypothetical protein|nr:winged helix-turn-helix domain-containing protein [Pirellulales bacterium]
MAKPKAAKGAKPKPKQQPEKQEHAKPEAAADAAAATNGEHQAVATPPLEAATPAPAQEPEAPAPALATAEPVATSSVDIFWTGPSVPAETEVSRQTTWLARCEDFQGKEAKVVLTVPRFEGAGRPRYVPMILNDEGGWIALESDRHGHCRGYEHLAKAIAELETFWRARTGRRQLTTNAAEIVLAAEQNGIAQITEETEDMTKKSSTKTSPNADAASAKATKKKGATPKKGKGAESGKMSAIDAAAKVLGQAKDPMNCQDMIKAMSDKGLWTSPGGKTPHATLYSAILREIKAKGKDSRFKKTERGTFALNAAAAAKS